MRALCGIFFCIGLVLAPPAKAQNASLQETAEEAVGLYRAGLQTRDVNERRRLLFLVSQKLETIRTKFPRSAIASQIALGRYRDVDILLAEREGRLWKEANPAAAAALATGQGSAPVPNFGRTASASPLVPSFNTPAPTLPAGIPAGTRLSRTEMIERLRATVVIIYSRRGDQYSFGTGFFISPEHVLTNTHVVEGEDKVIIANKAIGLRTAQVLSLGKTREGSGIDSAVLKVENFTYDKFLPFTNDIVEGQSVAIGGYPGKAMKEDLAALRFFALLNENRIPTIDSFPNIRFDFGTVQGIFVKKDTGIENIQTGVTSAKGNSGSPYINECGQVVGQEYAGSSVVLEVRQGVAFGEAVNFNWALSGRELIKFITAARAPVTVAAGPCH